MRRRSLSLVPAAILVAALAASPPAQAIHGCVSIGGAVNVTSGDDGPVHQNTTCNFTMVAEDTYSGVGAFSYRCPKPTGSGFNTVVHAATDVPVAYTLLDCKVGGVVTFTLEPGAIVAAGSALT